LTLVSAGRVGRAHGHDGAFYVERPEEPLEPGTEVTVAGVSHRVVHVGGTAERALLRLSGIENREAAVGLQGEPLLVEGTLEPGEFLAAELVGCEVAGLGRVERVLAGPSCDVLELSDGSLVPLVADAVRSVDTSERRIEVDPGFLGLDGETM
jgi:16S rRNA processing protein RimM